MEAAQLNAGITRSMNSPPTQLEVSRVYQYIAAPTVGALAAFGLRTNPYLSISLGQVLVALQNLAADITHAYNHDLMDVRLWTGTSNPLPGWPQSTPGSFVSNTADRTAPFMAPQEHTNRAPMADEFHYSDVSEYDYDADNEAPQSQQKHTNRAPIADEFHYSDVSEYEYDADNETPQSQQRSQPKPLAGAIVPTNSSDPDSSSGESEFGLTACEVRCARGPPVKRKIEDPNSHDQIKKMHSGSTTPGMSATFIQDMKKLYDQPHYDWLEDRNSYGPTTEARRVTSVQQLSLYMTPILGTYLPKVWRLRDQTMPPELCRACFAPYEMYGYTATCCGRRMCRECVVGLASTEVERTRRTHKAVSVPLCVLCGLKPGRDTISVDVQGKHRNMRLDRVVLGQTNPARGHGTPFVPSDIGFLRCFWFEVCTLKPRWSADSSVMMWLGQHENTYPEVCDVDGTVG